MINNIELSKYKKILYKVKNEKSFAEESDKLNRLLIITTIIFCITPFIFLLYLYYLTIVSNGDISKIIIENPMVTITLIISMIGPLIGAICRLILKGIKDDENIESIKVSFIILAISQLIIVNFIGVGLLSVCLYNFNKLTRRLSLKSMNNLKSRYSLRILMGSVAISLLCLMCAFIRTRLK